MFNRYEVTEATRQTPTTTIYNIEDRVSKTTYVAQIDSYKGVRTSMVIDMDNGDYIEGQIKADIMEVCNDIVHVKTPQI